MRTVLRKLFGASIGGGAAQSFFVFALTALIAGAPLAARAQDSAVVGTVTFRDKTATSVTVEGPLTFSGHETRAHDTAEWVAATGDLYLTQGTTAATDFLSINSNVGTTADWRLTLTPSGTDPVTFQTVTLAFRAFTSNGENQGSGRHTCFSVSVGDANTRIDDTAITGGNTVDEVTLDFGQPVTVTADTPLYLSCEDSDADTYGYFVGLSSITLSAPESDTVEWVAGPDKTGTRNYATVDYFDFRLSDLIHTGDSLPNSLPETAELRQATVSWKSGTDAGAKTDAVRRLVVTEQTTNTVVAVSEISDPLPISAEDNTTTFSFMNAETLSWETQYRGYFIDENTTVEVGDTLDAGLKIRFYLWPDNTDGLAVQGSSNYAAAIDFTLRTVGGGEEVVNGDAINLNFQRGATNILDPAVEYGYVPYLGEQWNWAHEEDENAVNLSGNLTDSRGRTGITFSATGGRKINDFSTQHENALLKHAILDSDNTPPTVVVDNIPYDTYDLYVYMAADAYSGWPNNCSVSLTQNDDSSTTALYYMPEGADYAVVTETNVNWGSSSADELEIGSNILRIGNLSAEKISFRASRVQPGRGCIAAIQIVERRRLGANAWEGTVAGVVNASAVEVQNTTTGARAKLTELGADDVVSLSFTEQVSLTVDADVNADTLTLTGEGENAPLIVQTAQTDGGAIVAENVRLAQGTLGAGVGAFASENPITLATGTTLGVMGTGGAAFTQAVTGAGAVRPSWE